MLINCPECSKPVSDKAPMCPQCGYPLAYRSPKYRKTNRRKRLPNGFGQITEIKGRGLREPFRAMVTVGKNENGRPICKILKPKGYFATYNEAYEALLNHSKNPTAISGITFKQLHDQWFPDYKLDLAERSIVSFSSAWSQCKDLYDVPVASIGTKKLKVFFDESNISPSTQRLVKSLLNCMYDYAVEQEIVPVNYARSFSLSKSVTKQMKEQYKPHESFTKEELSNILCNYQNIKYADMVLYGCYSGWRPSELCELLIENVDLKNWTVTGGGKTENGKNRIVPVHPIVRGLIKRRYSEAKTLGSKYLFNIVDTDGHRPFVYYNYSDRFPKILASLNISSSHRPHDTRKTFVTLAKEYKVDEYAIKRFVGHTVSDLTERVYTDRSVEWLMTEICKIK